MKTKQEITADFYAAQWIATLFSYDLPIEIVTKVLDIFLIDGWKVVFKLILALLNSIQSTHFSHPQNNF